MIRNFSFSRLTARFFRSLFWSINLLLALYTLLVYYLIYGLPIEHWSASMLMISLPVAWALNLIYLIFWLFVRSWRSVLSIVVMLAGCWLWPRTWTWHQPQSPAASQPTLSMLSYNVMGFNIEHNNTRDSGSIVRMTNWVVDVKADIKCFQEFQHTREWPVLRMVDRLKAAGYSYTVLLKDDYQYYASRIIGAAIFSRYPIIRSGRKSFGMEMNGLVWADIRVGADTLRIINVHLRSMGIRVGRVLRQDEMAGVRHETRDILGALKNGFTDRQQQVRIVEQYVAESPYPVIVTGDFNETPYSVVYGRMRHRLRNAFEDAGRGFSFTLNRMPRFVRIDNQFYDPHLTILNFQTISGMRYSDHFPILGTYALAGSERTKGVH